MSAPFSMEWNHKTENIELARSISGQLEIDLVLSRLLVARGIDSAEKAYDLLNPNLRQLHDPFLMKDMSRVVDRLNEAAITDERVLIHGDYDVDGITSTALLFSFLKDSYPEMNVQTYLPSRFGDGYGISHKCIENEIKKGTDLMITVDCGIKAVGEVKFALKNGIDVIVTDHHEPGEEIPDAFAVLDPKMADTGYPFRELAGVGVALKLAHAMTLKGLSSSDIRDYLDLAALGTIADMVPLKDENRAICYFGLQKIARTGRIGLRALIRESGIDLTRGMTSMDIGFRLGPRLNSAGRLGHPDLALDLLLTEDRVDSDLFSRELTSLNYRRRAIGKDLVDEILRRIDPEGMREDPSLVISGEGWNPGVIGISASKIMDALGKPVIVITTDGDIAKGSGRAPKGFDLVKALDSMDHLLIEHGGHERAAGLTMNTKRIDDMREELNSYLEMKYPDQVMRPILEIDLDLALEELDLEHVMSLGKLEPFGMENPPVQVSIRDVTIGNDMKAVGEGKHLKFMIEDGIDALPCIWFNSGDLLDDLPPGTRVDISGQPDVHHWRGSTSVQIKISDVHVL
ncbi:MAG: single-stranded-DNA-specific exonuclease RecJ [Candidatus Thermoplasmatota archaeon]|nr:single-stranded-DNA-specific exonuclease RecJ [Candidatus Thermoplasmatota archaeon]